MINQRGPDEPSSPCNGTCALDRPGGVCIGCHRTGDEIARWAGASPAEKRRIVLAARGRGGGATEPPDEGRLSG